MQNQIAFDRMLQRLLIMNFKKIQIIISHAAKFGPNMVIVLKVD